MHLHLQMITASSVSGFGSIGESISFGKSSPSSVRVIIHLTGQFYLGTSLPSLVCPAGAEGFWQVLPTSAADHP